MSVLATNVKWWQVAKQNGDGTVDITRLQSLQNIHSGITGCGITAAGSTTPDTAATASGAYYTEHGSEGGFVSAPSITYSFADTLQSTVPISFTLQYASGDFNFNPSAYVLQVTCGSNISPSVQMRPGGGNGTIPAGNLYDGSENVFISGDTNRIAVAIGEGPDLYGNLFFNIERTKNSDGTDSNEGCIFQWMYSGGGGESPVNPNPIGNMVIPASGTIAGFNPYYIAPLNQASATLSHSEAIGALPVTPFNFRPYFYGMGLQLYYSSDVAMYTPISIPIYGADHTYLPLNQGQFMQHTNPRRPTALLMRYE
jgi:hypothetical protein